MIRGVTAVVIGSMLSCTLVLAIPMLPDVANVPIARVIANLERMIAAEPANTNLPMNLARTHAMAYAEKADTAAVYKGQEHLIYSNFSELRPFPVKPAPDEAARGAAAAHLRAAIETYQEVVRRAPNNLTAHLGLAWCLGQDGQQARAIEEYRLVVRDGWPKESPTSTAPWNLIYVTEEAARTLLRLLDPNRDRVEISALQTKMAEMTRAPRAVTPIAIPLRDGLNANDVTNPRARVSFDADGTGFERPWTWITRDAAWLVFDKRNIRQVTSALQMFGGVTFWLFWDNGYEALRTLDDNGDGRIAGAELPGLALWLDENANGISEPGEVRTIADWRIVSLSCAYEFDPTHPDEIAFSHAGVTFANGTTRPTWDVMLHPWK